MVIVLIFNFSFGYLIKTQIKKLTNKNIELEYKSARTRILVGTIEFHEAVLHFNDISIDSNSSIFIESVSFEKFAITRLNLKALLFERSFNIEKVLLSGPTIDFLKDTTISRKDIFTKILTPSVVSAKSQSTSFSFEIGELEIEQGSFQLMEAERNDFSLGSVNLKLSNIGMDDLKAMKGDLPDLNAHFNIQLGVYDIQKELTGNAEILIDSIVFRKDKNLFEVGGIQLKRLKSSSDYAKSEISLFTDLISIHGFNLRHLLVSKDLKFDRLTISNTEIFEKLDYYNEIKISEDKPASKKQFVSNIVNAFITDTFNVQNFKYYSENNLSDKVDRIDNLNLWVYSIRVDSNFIVNREFLSLVEQSTILSGPISMHIPEKGIDFSCDTLVYLGPGKEQLITNLQLNTYPSLFSNTNVQPNFRFNSDSMIISGLDEREWIDSSVVELSVYIQNPQLFGSNVNFGKSKKKKSKGFTPDKIVLNKLNLINGNINIKGTSNEILEVELLNIEAVDLEVFSENSQSNKTVSWKNIFTSIENSKFFIPEKLMVQMDRGTINNNNLDFEGISYLENSKINNYQAPSKKAIDTTRFFAEQVKIDNFDIQAFINKKHLTIDNLAITRPTYFQYADLEPNNTAKPDSVTPILLYRRINKLLPDYFSYINIRDLSITDADVLYQMELDNLKYHSNNSSVMRNIEFDQNLPDGELPELTVDYYEFCITDVKLVSDKVQFITESVCYNSIDDNLTIINSHAENIVKNRNDIKTGSMQYNVTFPKITLTKPDFTPLSGGPVSFNIIHIDNPEIFIRIPAQKKPEKLSAKDFKILPFTYLEDGVSLQNGKVTICLSGETDSTIMQIGQIGFDAHDIYKIIGAIDYHSKNKNLFSYLDFQLNDILVKGPGMKLEIGKVDYDKRSGIISIHPIKQEMFSKPRSPEFRSLIDIPGITIEQPDVMLVNEKVKSYGAVNLLIPEVIITYESVKKEKPKENRDIKITVNDSSFRNFLGKVDFFHIDSTVLNNIGFSHHTISDSTGGSFDIERISLLVDKLKIDSSHFDFHKKRIAKDIVLQLYDREVVTADSMYRFKVNNVTYYYSRDKIVIDSFEVVPGFERYEFFERAGLQTDLMQVKFDRAVAEGIDLLSIIESKKVQVNKLTLDKFHLMDHRDQHYPRKENDFKKLPKESLFSLPFALKVDTVQVNNSFLLYGEFVDKSPEPGEIYFTNFDASIYNVSNISSIGNEHDSIFAHITTDIMDASKMTVDLTIPLDKDNDNFWIRGGVEKVDLRKFNSMTENLFGISIVRGKAWLDIPLITLTDTISTGSIIFEYDKLKLAMYNRSKAKLSRGLGSGLIDFMMNGVLIKSNNPTFLGKTRTGDVYAERNNERSFFNYVWKSTMSGLMATMGFYNKNLREEKKVRKDDEKIERKDERQMKKLK